MQYWVTPRLQERDCLSLSLVVGGLSKINHIFRVWRVHCPLYQITRYSHKASSAKFSRSLTMDHPKHESLVLHGRFKGLDGAETNSWTHFRGSIEVISRLVCVKQHSFIRPLLSFASRRKVRHSHRLTCRVTSRVSYNNRQPSFASPVHMDMAALILNVTTIHERRYR